jgi:hypothetical protein
VRLTSTELLQSVACTATAIVGLVAMITTKTQRRDYSKNNGYNSVKTELCINTALDKLGYVLD